ncbi:MAG: hypothetical protein ABIP78_13275 [Pyrinomonadaceae bacterium]
MSWLYTIVFAGLMFGAPTRSARQPYFNGSVSKTVNKQLSVFGFAGVVFNAFDYDLGGGPRYPQASPRVSKLSYEPGILNLYQALLLISGRSEYQSISGICSPSGT